MTYTEYLYHIEADFRLEKGLNSPFFNAAGIDVNEVLNKMDQWDIVNNNRENTYYGSRIVLQRNIKTLESIEKQLKIDKTIIDSLEI